MAEQVINVPTTEVRAQTPNPAITVEESLSPISIEELYQEFLKGVLQAAGRLSFEAVVDLLSSMAFIRK